MEQSTERSATALPAVAVNDLTVAYRENPVLWDLDLTVNAGTLTAIIGPNGAGKSTLIKTIMGLIKPSAGDVKIFGKSYREQRHLVGYVPQRGSVDWDFPTTVLDVVTMGRYGKLGWIRRPGKADSQAALEALQKVGMVDFATRQISQLSGGQQQRVFLARALVQDAQVYFMDEPFAGVDATTEQAILKLLRDLQSRGRTVLVVHHDLETVKQYFDHIVILNVELVAAGPMATTFTPENLRLAYGARLNAGVAESPTPSLSSAVRTGAD